MRPHAFHDFQIRLCKRILVAHEAIVNRGGGKENTPRSRERAHSNSRPFSFERPVTETIQCRLIDEVDINKAENYGICKLCCISGAQETPIHLVLECPYTWRGRAELFGEYDPSLETFSSWDPASLVKFFARYDVENIV